MAKPDLALPLMALVLSSWTASLESGFAGSALIVSPGVVFAEGGIRDAAGLLRAGIEEEGRCDSMTSPVLG